MNGKFGYGYDTKVAELEGEDKRVVATITTTLRQEVFTKLERHPKIVRVA